jgi:hypothetical protein
MTNLQQSVFIFPAFESNENTQTIVQPIIEWGPAANGYCTDLEGNFTWGMAPWFIAADNTLVAPLPNCSVRPGDTMFASMYTKSSHPCDPYGNCFWYIQICDVTQNWTCVTETSNGWANPMDKAASGVLEGYYEPGQNDYGFSSCSQVPGGTGGGTTQFWSETWNVAGTQSYPQFFADYLTDQPWCNYNVTLSGVNNSGGVTLQY